MYVTQTLLFLHFLLASGCRGLRCFTCLSPGGACDPEKTIIFQCPEREVQCVDVQVVGSFVAASDITLKGCREFTCSTDLSFSSEKSSVSVHCCEGSLCNDQVVHDGYTQYNGLECYSCNTVNGEGCAEEEVTTTPCCGPLTTCIEVTGSNVDDEYTTPVITKGCATPNMCHSDFLPSLQNLEDANVQCCNESLCNE